MYFLSYSYILLSLYLIAVLGGVNGVSFVFGFPRTDLPGEGDAASQKNKRFEGEKNRWLGTPPVPIKGRGSPTFSSRLFVVVFLGLVRCVLDNFILTFIHLGYPRSSFHPITSSSIHPNHPSPFPLLGYTYRKNLR